MLSNGVCGLLFLAALVSGSPLVSRPLASRPVKNRTANLQLENNLAWIRKWAAVGDSYASGIGAGKQIDRQCSRYDQSYPSVIRSNELFPQNQEFEFVACSGAKSAQVQQQILGLRGDLDAITISSGGNDVDLVGLLNECVYAWLPRVGCKAAIAASKKQINSMLPQRLDQVYAAAKTKLAPGGIAYVTGYARFFDETTRDCDTATFNFWSKHLKATWQYLTVERRKDLNEMVDLVNAAIKAAVEKAGDQFVLVAYDSTFGRLQGRYCLPGVKEPEPNRADLLFFQMGTKEAPETLTKRQAEDSNESENPASFPPNTIEGQIERLIEAADGNTQQQQAAGGNAPETQAGDENAPRPQAAVGNTQESQADGENVPQPQAAVGNTRRPQAAVENAPETQAAVENAPETQAAVGNAPETQAAVENTPRTQGSSTDASIEKRGSKVHLPVSWAQTFHPTQLGHSVIAGKVLYQMSVTGAQRQNLNVTGIENTNIEAKICPNTDSQNPLSSGSTTPAPAPPEQNVPKAIPKDQRAGCGKELGWNFPREIELTDKKVPMTDLWVRMREQVCNGVCDKLPGVPDDLVAAQRLGEKGCEYAVKLATDREAYFYSSGSGQNCFDATELMITQCMTLKKDAHSISEAGWVNGPNYGEFYQVGVRGLNAAGSHHPNLTTDKASHLPHLHVACASGTGTLADFPSFKFVPEANILPTQSFQLKIGGWDDGQGGRSIEKSLKRCIRTGVPNFSPTRSTNYEFEDGTSSTYEVTWLMLPLMQHCAEDKLADALGLNGFKLECGKEQLRELDVYS